MIALTIQNTVLNNLVLSPKHIELLQAFKEIGINPELTLDAVYENRKPMEENPIQYYITDIRYSFKLDFTLNAQQYRELQLKGYH